MGGIRIGRVFGVDIVIHISWFAILAFFAFSLATGFFPAAYDWPTSANWIVAVVATLLLFVSVLAHELGHSLVAARQGIPVKGITLFILGGVASIERDPSSPGREVVMAGVGPVVSLVLGIATLTLADILTGPEYLVAVLFYLGIANLSLAVFNLLPGFPLDGGRVLRALLWWQSHDFVKATRRATVVSRVFGYLLIALGLYQMLAGGGLGGLWLAFIGWMLNQASRASLRQAQLEYGLRGVTAGRVAIRPAAWLPPFVTLSAAARDYFAAQPEPCLPVEAEREGDAYDGALCVADLQRTPRPEWNSERARDAMTRAEDIPSVSADTPAWDALRLMAEKNAARVAVIQAGHLLGFVDQESAMRFLHRHRIIGAPGA
jgi:Zn-dependent protease